MKSPVQKRSVLIAGRKTSVSLEQAFWDGLKEVARLQGRTIAQTLDGVATARSEGNLSSAIRLFVLNHYRTKVEQPLDAIQIDSNAFTQPAFRRSA